MGDCPVCGLPTDVRTLVKTLEPLLEHTCPQGHVTYEPLLPKTEARDG